ncbi:MAG: secondary thiamine-phosphate synthase enzyme YjbQ [Candidatus Omnitrophica bacterium]|nr:secondary thiamine-phosphate synthase enzyme YjbQ [Candidatus Omnitrophota bacterium]
MKIITNYIELSTNGKCDIIDVTEEIQQNLRVTLLEEGNVTIFNPGSTAGITTVEYEDGLVTDIQRVFERLVPEKDPYAHDEAWHDGNGHGHIRSSLLGTSLVVPFRQAKLLLGTWQQIVFIDFDNRPRTRKIVTQFIGI